MNARQLCAAVQRGDEDRTSSAEATWLVMPRVLSQRHVAPRSHREQLYSHYPNAEHPPWKAHH